MNGREAESATSLQMNRPGGKDESVRHGFTKDSPLNALQTEDGPRFKKDVHAF